jgi:hypothetical protein
MHAKTRSSTNRPTLLSLAYFNENFNMTKGAIFALAGANIAPFQGNTFPRKGDIKTARTGATDKQAQWKSWQIGVNPGSQHHNHLIFLLNSITG